MGPVARAINEQIARLSDPETVHVFREPERTGEVCAIAYLANPGHIDATPIVRKAVRLLDDLIVDYDPPGFDELDVDSVGVAVWNDWMLDPYYRVWDLAYPEDRQEAYDEARWRLLLFLDEGLSAALDAGI